MARAASTLCGVSPFPFSSEEEARVGNFLQSQFGTSSSFPPCFYSRCAVRLAWKLPRVLCGDEARKVFDEKLTTLTASATSSCCGDLLRQFLCKLLRQSLCKLLRRSLCKLLR
eukprot:1414311-Pleurochrysis_carterae.AAC.1